MLHKFSRDDFEIKCLTLCQRQTDTGKDQQDEERVELHGEVFGGGSEKQRKGKDFLASAAVRLIAL